MDLMNSRIAIPTIRLLIVALALALGACTWTSGMLEGEVAGSAAGPGVAAA
jgi:hypothetical protein